jgi:hypothetical protein
LQGNFIDFFSILHFFFGKHFNSFQTRIVTVDAIYTRLAQGDNVPPHEGGGSGGGGGVGGLIKGKLTSGIVSSFQERSPWTKNLKGGGNATGLFRLGQAQGGGWSAEAEEELKQLRCASPLSNYFLKKCGQKLKIWREFFLKLGEFRDHGTGKNWAS